MNFSTNFTNTSAFDHQQPKAQPIRKLSDLQNIKDGQLIARLNPSGTLSKTVQYQKSGQNFIRRNTGKSYPPVTLFKFPAIYLPI